MFIVAYAVSATNSINWEFATEFLKEHDHENWPWPETNKPGQTFGSILSLISLSQINFPVIAS